jgi:light-regulated signal transduction histidine kinase (bacteriophytochrome)
MLLSKNRVQNIVGNALKFSGGKSPRVQVSAKRNKDDRVFSVEDNGIGIDKEYFEQISVIFQQLDRDMSNGTGIGLAIVRKL